MKRQSSPGTSIGQKKNIQAKEVYPRFFAVVVLVDVVVVFANMKLPILTAVITQVFF